MPQPAVRPQPAVDERFTANRFITSFQFVMITLIQGSSERRHVAHQDSSLGTRTIGATFFHATLAESITTDYSITM
jgi:hypothetical protein